MSDMNDKFKSFLLRISAILGIALILSGPLLMLQIGALSGGRNNNVLTVNELPSVSIDELLLDGYTLRSNATDYQIELFEILIEAQSQFYETESDEDLKNYASAIVRNFIADFFTLSNKVSRSDVGGLQFFSEEIVNNFREFAIDEFYLHLNQHIEMFESESLPTVQSTTIREIEFGYRMIELEKDDDNELPTEEELQEEEVRTITIDIEWSYESTILPYISEFQTEARFVLVEDDGNVSIYIIELIEDEYENQSHW